jgi:sugar phosphate isomerase/epimerase
MITIGVCQWMLDSEGVAAVQRASELGFEAMEIGVFSLEGYGEMRDPAIQAAYLEAAAAHGIELVAMSLGIFSQVIAMHSKAQEAAVWEMMSNMIDVAAAMKFELVCCAMFGDAGINNADEMARASAMLRRGCDYIGDRPLVLATENTLGNADNRELVEQVNHPKIRVLMDAYNGIWSGGYNAADMVRELCDVLCNVAHAKDGLKHQPDDVLIGQGDGDFSATAQALKDIGFEGYVMCENNYTSETEARTTADLATLKRMFEDMQETVSP